MGRTATLSTDQGFDQEPGGRPVETTLLELVQTLGDLTDDDREIVEVVLELLREDRVRLTGNFAGQRLVLA
ncbi:MAG: hypothetical protein JRH01_10735 [Deltaproteobacteria bacterium]|nr:hypothetical protein [Deltaproteobacteria bacterium]MBW2393057.1 hypothetical protein [Deltaproteobacteria bacterium]